MVATDFVLHFLRIFHIFSYMETSTDWGILQLGTDGTEAGLCFEVVFCHKLLPHIAHWNIHQLSHMIIL